MTCRDLVDFIQAWLDGELPPETRATFEGHLAACPNCVTYLDTYEATLRLGRAAAVDPASAPEELIRAVLAARRK